MKTRFVFRSTVFLLFSFFLLPLTGHALPLNGPTEMPDPVVCNTPTWPTTSNITMNAATFSWDWVSGALNYSVQTRVPNGTWFNVPGSPTGNTSITVDWFLPNTTYEWRVRTNCTNGESSYWTYPVTFTTLGWDPCNAPAWLYTNNITSTSATFDWEPVAGAFNYELQYRTVGGAWYNVPGGPWTETWHTVNGLAPGTCYEWRVRTKCTNWMYSDWSYPQSFCTLGSYCGVPTWPSTWDVTETTATLSWDLVWGAYNYTVQIRQGNGEWYDLQGCPTPYTWIYLNNLTPCTTYQWRVKSHCGSGGQSYWTAPVTFTTLCQSYCEPPLWLFTNNITPTSATLDWEPVYGANSYSVQYRVAGGDWYYLPGGPFTNSWAMINGLQPGTNYEWRVRSNCCNWSYSPWSYPAWFTTPGGGCARPSILTAKHITATSAELHWSWVWGAWSYTVEIREANGSWSEITGSPFTGTTAVVDGLKPGTIYQWRVKTNCEEGEHSIWTKPESFTTDGHNGCQSPYFLNTLSVTETSALLDWNDNHWALDYSLQYRIAGDVWIDIPGPITESSYILGGLTPNTAYEWRVQTHCAYDQSSDWTWPVPFTTVRPPCGVATGLSSTVTDTSATLSWNAVGGAVQYIIEISVPGFAWSQVPESPVTGTSVTLHDLIPGTDYEWRVRTHCTYDFSDWTSAGSFTTSGSVMAGGADCDQATHLDVKSYCDPTPSSNVGATASTPPPVGWCAKDHVKDVWFTFQMPDVPNPVVTIRTMPGTLTDGIMEVYRGNDCSNLKYIFCEDDNTWHNSSFMPVISITGGANEKIYVRVWGYAGTTGTFSICVFDYQSNDLVIPDTDISVLEGQELQPVDLTSATPTVKDVASTLMVHPNPARDGLNVRYAQTKDSQVRQITMMDFSGKVVLNKSVNADGPEYRDDLDVSHLAQGVYLLKVVTTSGILTEKIMITR